MVRSPARLHSPVHGDGEQPGKADEELEVAPVVKKKGEQRHDAGGDAPEVLDDDPGKGSVPGGEQLTGHDEPAEDDALHGSRTKPSPLWNRTYDLQNYNPLVYSSILH